MSPKQAPDSPQDGKEKPSRNLEMEGQRVRTITPSRKNCNASARQLGGAAKAEAKEAAHKKPVLTNAQPKKSQDKFETQVSTSSELPVTHEVERRNLSNQVQENQVIWTKRKSCKTQAKTTKTKERESPPPRPPQKKEGRIHS